MIRRRLVPRVSFLLLFSCAILLSYYPVLISAGVVTLKSIEIFKTHEWLPAAKPKVFFHCKGENEIVLPDVTEKHVKYTFKGEESWQPLTELPDKKCKRCGFYEKDTIKSNDVFDEWEFCASDFSIHGRYYHFKDKEVKATFLCLECVGPMKASDNSTIPKDHSNSNKMMHWGLIIVASCVASALFIGGLVAGCKYWEKRKRQQQQARFLQLFEDADDVEDELGLGPLSNTI